MFEKIRITQRFIAVIVVYTLAFVVVMAVSLWGLMSAKDSLKTVHDEAMKPAMLAGESIDKVVQNRLQVLLAFQHAPAGPLASSHTHPTTVHLEASAAYRMDANRIFSEMES
ncbi:MAG: Tar ligand binding domain-containing protein, partial [Rhodoferax sp.]|nr:Tar ligand binding domain-containing protein [Rhodoferax sp.]